MSADNGVYILETGTDKKEYRVRELQAVENYMWDHERGYEVMDPDIHIENARRMWKDCKVFTNEAEVHHEAFKMYRSCVADFGICEYGISVIEIPRDF